MSKPDYSAIPHLRDARALTVALFPAGEKLEAADPDRILSDVNDYFKSARWLRIGWRLLYFVFGFLVRLRTFRAFRKLSVTRQRKIINAWESNVIFGLLLKGVTAPFKVAYMLDEERRQKIGLRYGVPASTPEPDPRWLQQVASVDSLEPEQEIEAEVVIIGTGAGGAAAAYELASQGIAVAVLEEGEYYRREDFNGRIVEMMGKLYRDWGTTSTIGNTVIPVPIGRSVGGTTTINSGTCMRTPDKVLKEWQSEGLGDLTSEELKPIFAEVEQILGVTPAEDRYVGPLGDIIRRGAEACGLKGSHNLNRNAVGCDGQGLCQFGCPTDAKRSTNVSFMPRALQAGAYLFTGVKAHTLLRDSYGAMAGVVASGRAANGNKVKLTVKSSTVIVSTGTLLTPSFLHSNGVRSRWLGRNLSIHPAGAVTARFPGIDMRNQISIPQGFGVNDLADQGIMFEGGTVPLLGHGLAVNVSCEGFVEAIERYNETAYFGFMVKDTSRGRVLPRLIAGRPFLIYRMNKFDFDRLMQGIELLSRMYLRAGASQVDVAGVLGFPTIYNESDLQAFMRKRWRPRHFMLTAYHPLGTARLAADPAHGVVGADHQVFGHPGLYVMDGSTVPSSLGVNPQVTIMTLATRAARLLAARLSNQVAA